MRWGSGVPEQTGFIPGYQPPRRRKKPSDDPSYQRWRRKNLEAERARSRLNMKLWYEKNRDRALTAQASNKQKLMREFFARFGSECLCCGETEPAFLTVDHVEPLGGSAHKRRLAAGKGQFAHRHVSTYTMVLDLKKRGWPAHEMQVLCMNCNLAKRRIGVCPHGQRQSSVFA